MREFAADARLRSRHGNGFKIQTLNNISLRGLERLPRDRYEVASELVQPDAILVRSADVHALEIPASVLAVAAPAPAPTTSRWRS